MQLAMIKFLFAFFDVDGVNFLKMSDYEYKTFYSLDCE